MKIHTENVFSHPDYTVGSGITPDQPHTRVMDYTIGRDSHPATKTSIFYFEIGDLHLLLYGSIITSVRIVQHFL